MPNRSNKANRKMAARNRQSGSNPPETFTSSFGNRFPADPPGINLNSQRLAILNSNLTIPIGATGLDVTIATLQDAIKRQLFSNVTVPYSFSLRGVRFWLASGDSSLRVGDTRTLLVKADQGTSDRRARVGFSVRTVLSNVWLNTTTGTTILYNLTSNAAAPVSCVMHAEVNYIPGNATV